ncbi:hypothetical protein [Luteimonas sp. MC1825]|uniref:hypothetical protein n=1 Tax=Luteimonas sp. MC1825 TaxID=2761107 RepID=UPI001618D0AB|nr:hypothetical protein [Luteimonas sp. MC1825]MBB6599997.1 hypothetical protein [Luteimonas sp. MC1825]QOC87700.1 hypothetical protein IDM46_10720 [Luteimonas sp. MC1825]
MKLRLILVMVVFLTATVYWPGLRGPLIFDDIQNLLPITQWLESERGWLSVVFGNDSGMFGRPISMASFVFNVAVLGPEVWSLKLGNLLLHLINGSLVYLLFAALLSQRAMARAPLADNRWLPVLGAAIWLLHPLLASTVLYVVQRMAMLSALFILLAMLAYVQARLALTAGQYRKAWTLLALVPLCTVLAALSKENGVLAPALCAVIELCVFAPRAGIRRPWPSRLVIALGLLAPALIAVVLTAIQYPAITVGYANRPFTLIERLLTQPRVLWDYIGSLLMPHGPRLGLYHDDYPISHGLFDPASTALAIAGWLLALLLAWRWRRRIPGLLLGLSFFLVGHALESSVFPLLMYFEHRNYLPAIGVIWALLSLAAYCVERLRPHVDQATRIFSIAAIALVLALSVATAGRALVWQSQSTLLAQAQQYHPDSRWLRVALIQRAMSQTPPAIDDARDSADRLLASRDPSTHRLGGVLKLMMECAAIGNAPLDLVHATFAGDPKPIEPDLLVAFESLSEGLISQPCTGLVPRSAAEQFAAMLDRSTLSRRHHAIWRLRLKAAKLNLAAGRSDEALRQAQMAWADGAADAPVPLMITALLLQRGETAEAAAMLDKARVKVRADDVTGMRLVNQYREEIERRLP